MFFNILELTWVYWANPWVGSDNYDIKLVFYSLIVFNSFFLILSFDIRLVEK
jgi:hypothetical protein